MQFDRNKLVSVIAYVVSQCVPERLGAVKLHKVLYFSDMLRYAETGNAITGSTYIKSPFGPTCKQLPSALSVAVSSDIIRITHTNYFGYKKKEFVSLCAPDISALSADEIALIDEMITFVCNDNSARTISDFSHNRAWESVGFGEEINYNSVYHIFPVQVSAEAFDWAAGEAQTIETTKSRSEPVDFVLFAALRSRVLASSRS